jgi:uncharacterized membrane protein YbaN (DUF454 family)
MTRIPYLCLGWLMVLLGIIGAFVPLMPTTIFLILASWFFARSSPRLEAWLLSHPRFGGTLRTWNETGAVPGTAKVMACGGMIAGFALFLVGAHPKLWIAAVVAMLLLASAIYVVSRPSPRKLAIKQPGESYPCC